MNGFHEAINFKSESGIIRAYLSPKRLAFVRNGEPFAFLNSTCKRTIFGRRKNFVRCSIVQYFPWSIIDR
jgi:hypothetical protein